MPDTAARVSFLKNCHLFKGIKDGDLANIVEKMEEREYELAQEVFLQGAAADATYFIFRGGVDITQEIAIPNKKEKKKVTLATLVPGDYFGEEGPITGAKRSATVTAQKGTVLLRWGAADMKATLRKFPTLQVSFSMAISSRRLARATKFDWLQDNEVIYFAARKHIFKLYAMLLGPIGVLMLALFVLMGGFLLTSEAILAIGAGILVIGGAWGVWNYIDWGNDFYIVTNSRVIRLEKVVFMYDSREEAPLETVLSHQVQTDMFGRWFGYGDITVNTYTGKITMVGIDHPAQAASFLDEYMQRVKNRQRQQQDDVLRKAIRDRIRPPEQKPAPPPPPPAPAKKPIFNLRKFLSELFVLRVESGGTVTYRKHWMILLYHWLKQLGALVVLIGIFFAWGYFSPEQSMPLSLIAIDVLVILIMLGWMAYDLADWRNDRFQVTADQVIDMYKKPFSTEDRRAAPIENILSTEYHRHGLLGLLFNFGTVYIVVGEVHFDFEDVVDPPQVQQDIIRRMAAKRIKKQEDEGKAERERMAQWLATYHKVVEELRQMEQNKNDSG